jgi:hypothetical protein
VVTFTGMSQLPRPSSKAKRQNQAPSLATSGLRHLQHMVERARERQHSIIAKFIGPCSSEENITLATESPAREHS